MKNNPQINNFLDTGIKLFAERGIDGIKIEEICEEVGVSKSSFYHYFGSKKGFVDRLFDYWYDITTSNVYEQIKDIDSPRERFLKLKELIDANQEIEYCYLQMKLYALSNEKAKAAVEKASKGRFGILNEIFKMAGQSDEEAGYNSRKMILLYYGRVALTHGYSSADADIDLTNDKFLEFLGIKD